MDVSFVVMPFCNVHMPSLGVSLLKAELARIGISSSIHYFNLDFAERIGLEIYDKIAEELPSTAMIGEIIFARSVFGNSLPENSRYIRQVLAKTLETEKVLSHLDKVEKEIRLVEDSIPGFIQECAQEILRERPKLVGFTSTFHQNCASMSLASALKNLTEVPIIFGGANCEGEMGRTLLDSVNCIDFVCSGEGDIAFIEFMKSFLKGETPHKINGIISRQSNALDVSLTNPVMKMDELPMPDFDDYFIAVREGLFKRNIVRSLVMETSRGCWWGEKFQCTFCGLNGSTMKYRSKMATRALEELIYLKKRYKIRKFHLVDNILDFKYSVSLFPEISRQRLNIDLFYDTKSNLTKQQLIVMKQCGVSEIQPGIESLSDAILKIMQKGVSAFQNIQVLKWCMELDITPYWNFLWGFPGEPKEEYLKMSELVPMLTHLPPPQSLGKIVLDRFSPYYFEPSKNGIVNVRPLLSYRFVYPFSEQKLKRIVYHFDFGYSDDRNVSSYTKKLELEINKWKMLWKEQKVPALNMVSLENLAMINDTRPSSAETFYMLKDQEARLYQLCQVPQTMENLTIKTKEDFPEVTQEAIISSLHSLVNKNLLLHNNGMYLSLAISLN